MIQRSLFAFLFILGLISSGCKENDSNSAPCKDLINETAPAKIMVQFVDKATKQNLILSKGLKASDFSISFTDGNKPFVNWRIVSEMGASPLNGSLELSVLHEPAGEYNYQIRLANIGMATLAFTVSKTATNNLCKPHAYPISNIKIADHPYKPLSHEGKSHSNILVLEL